MPGTFRLRVGGPALVAILVALLVAPAPLGSVGAGSHAGPASASTADVGAYLLQQALLSLNQGAGTQVRNSTTAHWTPLNLSVTPGPRAQEAIAYDRADGYVVIFSGFYGNFLYNDTWTFAHGVWTNISATAGSPGPRRSAMMTWDQRDGYVVLYGGSNAGNRYYNDTWTFVHGAWSPLPTATAPPPRRSYGLTYDAADRYVLLFGGHTRRYNGTYYDFYNDTWGFAGGVWRQIVTHGTPPARAEPNMVWDAKDRFVLVFGGYDNPNIPAMNDTWSYLHGTWTNLTATVGATPHGRDGAGIDYNVTAGYVLMFGGHSRGFQMNDTWAFYHGKWILLNETLSPPATSGDRLSWDATDRCMLLFGGALFPAGWANETWTFC
jgi:Galactose oxidase, central domain